MPDPHDPIQELLDILRQHAPELLPVCRFLILGPYLAAVVLAEHSRQPTVRELITLKRVIERHGPGKAGMLASLLEASGKSPAVRVEIQLDRLVELDPSLWTHLSQVLERPVADAGELLEACRLRMEGVGEEEMGTLEGVAEKLELGVRLEGKARERRKKKGGEE